MKLCGFEVGLERPLFLIAGPCAIESRQLALDTAGQLKEICAAVGVPFIYKSSFDKANRSSGKSFRGVGMDEGLKILADVKAQIGVPVLTDIHDIEQIKTVAAVVDVLQTPAFLCRQTDFIHAAASAGRPVNIKKGQFLAPGDMKNVVDKAREVSKQDNIMVCERGASFGYNNLVIGHALADDHARDGLSGRVRRDAFGAVAGRAGHLQRRSARIRSGARARRGCERRRAAYSWKRIRTRRKRCPTDPTRGRSSICARCSKRCRRSTRWSSSADSHEQLE